ncbi:sulfatase family protein [Paenibacillus cymbidii]|uniref:sulfatase family protein n=1 Tax=Paenibacillus cymbidii TaxID=1639034 RepID=UPI0010809014|nr:sulfatase-like hydrolase/transferase [Paenibacillus cymbidii]
MPRTNKPNVIVVTTDQQRYDSIRINGNRFIQTPHLDRLGREGAVFERAYCPNTVCTPSRVSLMTGMHLSRHGAYNIGTFAHDYGLFLSRILRDNGYRTQHIGKAHWHPWQAESPETAPVDEAGTPFRDFVGFDEAELTIGHATGGVTGHYASWLRRQGHDPRQFRVNARFPGDANGTGDWEMPTALHSGAWVAERANAFLERHAAESPDQPFYLNLGFQDPHHPHVVPYDYKNRVDPDVVPPPDTDWRNDVDPPEHVAFFRQGGISQSRFPGKFTIGGNSDEAWAPYFADTEKSKLTRAYYYTMVQLFDEQLGTIMETLDRLKLGDNTILVFASDHGEMLGDHAIGQKGPMTYEGVTHIPLLIRYPHGFAPRRVTECVSLVDLLPTMLDFIGIADPVKRDGISLRAALERGEALPRPGVRIEYKEEPDRIRYKCWVTPQWKLAVYGGETFGELYDLQADPGEKRNLFASPDHAAVRQRLLTEMLADQERSEPVSIRPCRV